jgi:hypothetical protein
MLIQPKVEPQAFPVIFAVTPFISAMLIAVAPVGKKLIVD